MPGSPLRYKPAMSTRSGSSSVVGLAALSLAAVTLAAGLAGCGDSANDPAQKFLGTWHYDQVSGVIRCPGKDDFNDPPRGNKTFAPGLTGGIVDVTVSPLDADIWCNFHYAVSGLTAMASADQTCALKGGDVYSVSNAADNEYASFTLTGPDLAEELSVGTLHLPPTTANPDDPPVVCSYDLIGHLTKVAKD